MVERSRGNCKAAFSRVKQERIAPKKLFHDIHDIPIPLTFFLKGSIMQTLDRRNFLKTTTLLAGSALLGSSVLSPTRNALGQANVFTPTGGEKPVEHLTGYVIDEHQAWFRRNNTALTSYRAHTTQKYPYFFPVAGPKTGLSLTSETGLPWPHHRSLFFGCDRVNGGNYWQEPIARGQIVSQGIKLGKIDETSGELSDRCLWKKPNEDPIIEDKRKFKIHIFENGNYYIDSEFELKMLTDITIQKTNHGLYAIRCAQDISVWGGGRLLNSEGDESEKGTWAKPARWCTFFGPRAGLPGDVVEGIALLTHKDVPHPAFKDCPWFTRDYGNISPMPMQWFNEPLKLPKDELLKLKYRVVAYGGTPEQADLNGLWEDFNAG